MNGQDLNLRHTAPKAFIRKIAVRVFFLSIEMKLGERQPAQSSLVLHLKTNIAVLVFFVRQVSSS